MRTGFTVIITMMALSMLGAAQAVQITDRTTLNSILSGNRVLEDFEGYNIADGSAKQISVASLDSDTIIGGYGSGLVKAGATYSCSSPYFLQWNGKGFYQ